MHISHVILFSTFAICFSSLLIAHASTGGFVARRARSERGGKNTCCCGIEGGVETVVNSSPCLSGRVSSIGHYPLLGNGCNGSKNVQSSLQWTWEWQA